MTALIGKKFEDSVLIVADKRITYRGTEKFSDDEKKIIVLNHKVIFAFAGVKNVIDLPLEELKIFASKKNSLEEIEAHAKKLFVASLNVFKKFNPEQDYATVYILAGFAADGFPRITYFSSDDDFQKGNLLEYFYKTFPNTEMEFLRNYLIKEVDITKKSIKYYIRKFSSAIRRINNVKVGKNAYAIFLSKKGLLEIEINEQEKITIVPINLNS
jgi:20S proteasome alpha/beta subunit